MSSGTRLVTRLLAASPDIEATHDMTHGARPPRWPVVFVTRDETARQKSAFARWPGGRDPIAAPSDPVAVVAYEDVVSDKGAVIARLADLFGVAPWTFDEDIYDANAESGSRCGPLPSWPSAPAGR